jgi:hypothetical protein
MAVAAALALHRLTTRRPRLAAALALATGIELLAVASNRPMNTGEDGWKPHDSTRQMMHSPQLLATLRALAGETNPPLRTDTVEYSPRFTTSAPLFRLPSANGDNPLAPLRMLAYRGLYSEVVPWQRQYPIRDLASPWISAANAGFLMREGPPLDPARMAATHWQRLALTAPRPLTVYRNPDVLPRYRLVSDVRPAGSPAEALSLLPAIDPRTTAVVECPVSHPSTAGDPGTVLVVQYTPERVILQATAARPTFLIAAEGYNTGWRATVDGVPQSVCPANVAFMALPLAAGNHLITLQYRPPALAWWAALSLLTWIALAASCLRTSWNQSSPTPHADSPL